jgi:hypothetical protein
MKSRDPKGVLDKNKLAFYERRGFHLIANFLPKIDRKLTSNPLDFIQWMSLRKMR